MYKHSQTRYLMTSLPKNYFGTVIVYYFYPLELMKQWSLIYETNVPAHGFLKTFTNSMRRLIAK